MLFNELTNEALILISDGTYTIGYIDEKPAEWDGNYAFPENDTEVRLKNNFDTIVISQDEYIVDNGMWTKSVTKQV